MAFCETTLTEVAPAVALESAMNVCLSDVVVEATTIESPAMMLPVSAVVESEVTALPLVSAELSAVLNVPPVEPPTFVIPDPIG